jgi:hypothetical protein
VGGGGGVRVGIVSDVSVVHQNARREEGGGVPLHPTGDSHSGQGSFQGVKQKEIIVKELMHTYKHAADLPRMQHLFRRLSLTFARSSFL